MWLHTDLMNMFGFLWLCHFLILYLTKTILKELITIKNSSRRRAMAYGDQRWMEPEMCWKEENVEPRYFRWSVYGSTRQNRQYVNILKFSSKNRAKKLRKKEGKKTVGHLHHEGRKPNPSEKLLCWQTGHTVVSARILPIFFFSFVCFRCQTQGKPTQPADDADHPPYLNFFSPTETIWSLRVAVGSVMFVDLLLQTAGAWSRVLDESSRMCLWRILLSKHRLKSSVVSHVFKTN